MALQAQKTEAAEVLLAAYPTPSGEAKWAADARAKALATFAGGAPSRRDEYWKYTNPTPLTAATAPTIAQVDNDVIAFSEIDALKIVYVDGVYRADLSDDLTLANVEIETLASATSTDIHWAKDVFGVLEADGQNPVARPLAALNSAVATEGMVIRVTGQVPRPISLQYLRENDTADAMIHHVIKLEAGADLTLLEDGHVSSRFNTSLEVDVADNAAFHHVRVQGREQQRNAATHMFARLGTKSSFKSFTLSVNGALTRNECVITFNGDDANATVGGAAAGDGAFHHDDTIFITHNAKNCESRQVFKKVLRNGATGVFQGKILVKQIAQKTDGYQIAQGLLLDDDCNFLAKPELEIYADDVVCSHGSTCGSTDETALFYLTSRGIPKAVAEDMLVLAFLDEAIQEIEDETLADGIRTQLQTWMADRG